MKPKKKSKKLVEPASPMPRTRAPRKTQPVGSSGPRASPRRNVKSALAEPTAPLEPPRPLERMVTRKSTNSLPPPRPPSPSPPPPKQRVILPPHLRPQKRIKRATVYREESLEPEVPAEDRLTTYFLVFAQNMQLLLAMIGENGSYMRDMAERYQLTHLSIESDKEVALKHGTDLAGRFLYVLAGLESCVKRAVEDLAKVVHAFTGYRPSVHLDSRCRLGDVDLDNYCPAIFRAFDALPRDHVSLGCPPLIRAEEPEAGPSKPPPPVTTTKTPTTGTSRSATPKPISLLDVSNAYAYPLPHWSVARLLRRDGGLTLKELTTSTGLSHLEIKEDALSMLLIGSLHAIKHACELLCSLIRSQTCFMPATFEARLVERLDPLAPSLTDLLPDSSGSSSDGGVSSKVPEPSSATSVGSGGHSPKMAVG